MRRCPIFIITGFLVLFSVQGLSEQNYWLCGPDEDGCPEESYESCACIPYDTQEANQPYCFDFDELSCEPLSKHPHCNPHFIFQNQTSCLGTIFHSMPELPCTLTNYTFCHEHHTAFCATNGIPETCHSETKINR